MLGQHCVDRKLLPRFCVSTLSNSWDLSRRLVAAAIRACCFSFAATDEQPRFARPLCRRRFLPCRVLDESLEAFSFALGLIAFASSKAAPPNVSVLFHFHVWYVLNSKTWSSKEASSPRKHFGMPSFRNTFWKNFRNLF